MPRVACLDSQTKKEREIYALITHHMITLNKTDEEMAKYIGIHLSTFRRKKRHPNQFTLTEMQHIAKYLNFDKDDKALCL